MLAEWKRVARTVVQIVLPLSVALPEIVDASGIDDALPWVAGMVATSAALTRIMAVPAVQRWLLWLNTDESSTTKKGNAD